MPGPAAGGPYRGPVRSLISPPVAFAHRGGMAHAPENTLDAFALALRMGATGLESDVWLTADGVPVLDHGGRARSGLRRVPISRLPRASLPAHVPSLPELYQRCGTGFELSLDVNDLAAAEAAVLAARQAGEGAAGRLWLCHPSWQVLAGWRERVQLSGIRLVNSTRLKEMRQGAERRASQLSAAGIEGVNLHYSDWSGGLTTLFHRFGCYVFAWDAQHERVIREMVRLGVDGIHGDHVDRLIAVISAGDQPPATGVPGAS